MSTFEEKKIKGGKVVAEPIDQAKHFQSDTRFVYTATVVESDDNKDILGLILNDPNVVWAMPREAMIILARGMIAKAMGIPPEEATSFIMGERQ